MGESKTGTLLVLLRVVLSMQLSFAIFPLLFFTSDRRRMGEFANPTWAQVVGYAICTVIAGLNLKLLYDTIGALWLRILAAVLVGFELWTRLITPCQQIDIECVREQFTP